MNSLIGGFSLIISYSPMGITWILTHKRPDLKKNTKHLDAKCIPVHANGDPPPPPKKKREKKKKEGVGGTEQYSTTSSLNKGPPPPPHHPLRRAISVGFQNDTQLKQTDKTSFMCPEYVRVGINGCQNYT